MNKMLACCAGLLAVTLSAQADTIAQWTFESMTANYSVAPGASIASASFAPEVGSGTAFGYHALASAYSDPAGNGSTHSLSSTAWSVNDYYQFSVSTLNLQNIGVSYDQTGSSTGPRDFAFEYSTDNGATFNVVSSYSITSTTWSAGSPASGTSHSFDFSGIDALNNQSLIEFRIVDTSTSAIKAGTTVAPTGTGRVDNFTVATVPEPASLLGLGALALLAGRKLLGRKA
jgi:hypothetical protein